MIIRVVYLLEQKKMKNKNSTIRLNELYDKISSNNTRWASSIDNLSLIKAIVYLYGISVRFDWLWECGTLGIELVSRIPQMANSWADPERLRSLPLRLLPPPLPPPPPAVTAWCCNVLVVGVGAEIEVEVEETFFFACPPKKNLYNYTSYIIRLSIWKNEEEGEREGGAIKLLGTYHFFCEGCTPEANKFRYWSERINLG